MDRRTDEELLTAARDDVEAFSAIYERHGGPLLGYCVKRTGNAELGADVMAETFAIALEKALTGRRLPKEVAPWLYGVARNRAADALRRGRAEDRARRRLGIDPLALTDDDLDRVEQLADIEGVAVDLDDLPASEREAVHAHVVQERSYKELARDTDVSEATARQRVSRGLARLRTRVERS